MEPQRTHSTGQREAAFDAQAFVSDYHALGGRLTATPDPKDPGIWWFGNAYPHAGRGAPGVAEMLAQLAPGSDKEAAVFAHLVREAAAAIPGRKA